MIDQGGMFKPKLRKLYQPHLTVSYMISKNRLKEFENPNKSLSQGLCLQSLFLYPEKKGCPFQCSERGSLPTVQKIKELQEVLFVNIS